MSHEFSDSGKHPKYEFQVERLAFFSDAVFAIAITLLVIEFKVPAITHETTYVEAWQLLCNMKYQLAATALSFLLIAVNWVRHHILFKYIHNYNKPILRTSLFMLLPIILFPFTTAFYAESFHSIRVLKLGLQLFLFNNMIVAVCMYRLYWLATKKYPEMAYPMEEKDKQVIEHRLLLMTIVMTLMFILSFISLDVIAYGASPWIISAWYTKYQKRKKLTPVKDQHAR